MSIGIVLIILISFIVVTVYIATLGWLLCWALLDLDVWSGVYAIALITIPPTIALTYKIMKEQK